MKLKINDMIHHYTAALAWGGRTTEGKPAYPTSMNSSSVESLREHAFLSWHLEYNEKA